MSFGSLLEFVTILLATTAHAFSFRLQSSSTVTNIHQKELHDFLATPTNWPQIVLSSHSVKCPSIRYANCNNDRVDIPLQEGDCVEEIFGLPPLLPLSVVWRCVKSDPMTGSLQFYSEEGVPGFANQCKMTFDIESRENNKCTVDLTMEFEPQNPIVPFGIPLLSLDNNLALNVLLPTALAFERSK